MCAHPVATVQTQCMHCLNGVIIWLQAFISRRHQVAQSELPRAMQISHSGDFAHCHESMAKTTPRLPFRCIAPTLCTRVTEHHRVHGSRVTDAFCQIESVKRDVIFEGSASHVAKDWGYENSKVQELSTCGDGACALHAAFGTVDERTNKLVCPQARQLLRSCFGKPWQAMSGGTSRDADLA